MRDEHALPGTDRVVDGTRVYVVPHGAGDGLPVLLVHGVPTSSYLWRDVQRDLGRAHPTYAVDLPGFGCSERPGNYGLDTAAAVLRGLLAELGLDRVAVVGHDVGGGVAVHLAQAAPDLVAALVVVDAPLHADVWPVPLVQAMRTPVLGEAQVGLLRTVPGLGPAFLGSQLRRGLVSAPSAHVLAQYAAPLLTPDGTRGLLGFVRGMDPDGVEAALRAVAKTRPALVLWADSDAWFSTAYGRRVAKDLGGSFVEIADAGHFVPEDRPERVAEEVAAFLAEVG